MGGIRDDVIASDFDGAATIRLVLFDAETRRKEQELLLIGLLSHSVNSLTGTAQPSASQEIFKAGDPRLSDFTNPSVPTNRVVMYGV